MRGILETEIYLVLWLSLELNALQLKYMSRTDDCVPFVSKARMACYVQFHDRHYLSQGFMLPP